LTRLGRHPYLAPGQGPPAADAPTGAKEDDEEGLARVLELLRKASGTDFSAYKKTTLRRRIARRMALLGIETLRGYARRLEGDVAEGAALYEDCLISVTSFFRDPEVFRALSDKILPLLLEDRPSDAPLRVWVPGCATGEEVYSTRIVHGQHVVPRVGHRTHTHGARIRSLRARTSGSRKATRRDGRCSLDLRATADATAPTSARTSAGGAVHSLGTHSVFAPARMGTVSRPLSPVHGRAHRGTGARPAGCGSEVRECRSCCTLPRPGGARD
jgi:hypothetical protein